MAEPIEINAPRGARLLEILWSDGERTFFRHGTLRGFCPCAVCQGHEGTIRWHAPPEDAKALELSELVPTGQYGVRIEWADGHTTGIYSFRYLRDDLAPLYEKSEDLRALEALTFKG